MPPLPLHYRPNRRDPIRWVPILTTATTLLSIPLLIVAVTLATASQAELRFDLPLQQRPFSFQLDPSGLVYGDILGAKARSARQYESWVNLHNKLDQLIQSREMHRRAWSETGDRKYLLLYEPNHSEPNPIPLRQFNPTDWRHSSNGVTLLDFPVTLSAAIASFALLTTTSLRLLLKSLPLRTSPLTSSTAQSTSADSPIAASNPTSAC